MRSELKNQQEMLDYLDSLYPEMDSDFAELLSEARKNSDSLNKTQISLTTIEAQILSTVIQLHQPKKMIEIGTLTGYSALWIARSMQQGQLFTIEKDPKHAEMAKATLAKMKSSVQVNVLNGDAREVLKDLAKQGPFDAIFIDGNKAAYGDYLDWAEENIRAGGLILADNVFAGGGVYGQGDGRFTDKMINVLKELNQRLADPKKYSGFLFPTAEGLFVARKN